MVRMDRFRCPSCEWRVDVAAGRLVPHKDGERFCPGSGRVVSAEAFGPVLAVIPMGQAPCTACGRHIEVMTLHQTVRALWPCGDSFANPSTESDDIPALRRHVASLTD
ncbi:hypothetical protein GCM10010174_06040 [Kutzneria viridogrisea]|uniref:Uncharacterized protein n=2 Tax=Kutzneria TaxID=43356 RepID=W5WB41_9PSEU|nr:hypothetical protein [Kutzneria albida]AHH97985.1 hypothetical protein KALB_4623 [Kutzneria albida DSM 43870]MBA8924358.1 hypothetical protein [Kutzneria viridogrisea]